MVKRRIVESRQPIARNIAIDFDELIEPVRRVSKANGLLIKRDRSCSERSQMTFSGTLLLQGLFPA
jgi:hypothetical protein